ncbi:RagB/SusD family nutrient uptake outer membrane protein [Pedobacter sp. KBW01]|uniref:RagB/SusD family nutrient uptake outer membrane protein n=1 Tax=Pedobacter sp. KBW01 TaxID=2153364 RepID=UPI000F5B61A5|nr:RagB/SusD family nutrient uptake outer membrane protein [Pedobacter sp. KBW01]RQO71057.1 RagB/SusD family nutrient uptake outer membrane protein [Pedobacter sp. KBW01]
MKLFHIKTYKLKLATAAILAIPLVGSIASCKKEFLEKTPELTLPDQEAFANPTRILGQVNGLYVSSKSGSLFGGRYLIYNDIRAEEFVNRTGNGVTGYDVYQGTNNSTNTYVASFFSQAYLTINRANLFLDGLAKNSTVLTPAINANYAGEAKFVRALNYFALIQIFAKPYIADNGTSRGLPLRLTPETSLANNALKSSTVAAIYAQIIKDLDEAETGLPDTYSTPLLRTTRAHKNSAIALKTRVYLAMGNYAKVLEEGNKLVPQIAPFTNSARTAHALQPSVVSVFQAPFTTSESIFSFPMADTNAPGTQNQLGYYYSWAGNGNLEYSLNKTGAGIYADVAWPTSDARKSLLTQDATISGVLHSYPIKYGAVSPFTDFVPIIRYAEVLLNVAEAEALAPGGNLIRSKALLQAVRTRSDAGFVYGVLVTPAALEAAILKERRIELLAEGFRYNDLARKAAPLPSFGAGTSIPLADQRYTFPIPIGELNTNPLVNTF